MADYASIEDVTALWRPLKADESARAAALLPVISARLRVEARRRGYDLDELIAADPDLGQTAKSVTVDITARTLLTSTEGEPVSQFSQTAGPYSMSGTYLVPGGGLFIKNSELEALGLLRQRVGPIEFYDWGRQS